MPRPRSTGKNTSSTIGTKNLKVQWEKSYAYRTDRLIEWCWDNPSKRLQLFSDSTQDAINEGRTKSQLSSAKKTIFEEIAKYIFELDAELSDEWVAQPKVLITATQRHYQSLRTKYAEHIKALGQTGAGYTMEELEIHGFKSFTAKVQAEFLWFSELHGWWRKNPACNVAYSTAHAGQDFAGQAAILFGLEKAIPFVDSDNAASSISEQPSGLVPLSTRAPSTSATINPSAYAESSGRPAAAAENSYPDDSLFNDFFLFDDDLDFSLDLPLQFDATAAASSTTAGVAATTTITPADLAAATSSMTTGVAATTTIAPADLTTIAPQPSQLSISRSAAPTIHSITRHGLPSPLPPNTISLNDDFPPPHPPPLVPRDPKKDAQRTFLSRDTIRSSTPSGVTDNSDSDLSAAYSLRGTATSQLKRKTPTPEVSSEENEPKSWFSMSSQPTTSSSTSARKRVRTSVADRVETSTIDMAETLRRKLRLDEENHQSRRQEREADRALKRWSRQEKVVGSEKQREHELEIQDRQHKHERVMAQEERETLCIQLELQRLKVQEQALRQGHSGEDIVMGP